MTSKCVVKVTRYKFDCCSLPTWRQAIFQPVLIRYMKGSWAMLDCNSQQTHKDHKSLQQSMLIESLLFWCINRQQLQRHMEPFYDYACDTHIARVCG